MIRMCHIAPTAYMHLSSPWNDCFLSLAHLIEKDDTYVMTHGFAYDQAELEGREIVKIMDNSAYEMFKEHGAGYVFNPAKLIDQAKKIKADYIVLPDYPGRDSFHTKDGCNLYAQQFKDAGFGTFFCPQSTPGNLGQYLECIQWGATNPLVDYIGISILGVPNAFGVLDNPLQRYNSRAALMRILDREGTLDLIKHHGTKIHFLGMLDGPREIDLVAPYHKYIDSWDSSAAVWAAINGVSFDDSPTGLLNGKVETPVDFNAPYNELHLKRVLNNISFIHHLL